MSDETLRAKTNTALWMAAAITLLPLATAVTLNYTSAIFLAVYLALAGLRITSGIIGAMVIGLLGGGQDVGQRFADVVHVGGAVAADVGQESRRREGRGRRVAPQAALRTRPPGGASARLAEGNETVAWPCVAAKRTSLWH